MHLPLNQILSLAAVPELLDRVLKQSIHTCHHLQGSVHWCECDIMNFVCDGNIRAKILECELSLRHSIFKNEKKKVAFLSCEMGKNNQTLALLKIFCHFPHSACSSSVLTPKSLHSKNLKTTKGFFRAAPFNFSASQQIYNTVKIKGKHSERSLWLITYLRQVSANLDVEFCNMEGSKVYMNCGYWAKTWGSKRVIWNCSQLQTHRK